LLFAIGSKLWSAVTSHRFSFGSKAATSRRHSIFGFTYLQTAIIRCQRQPRLADGLKAYLLIINLDQHEVIVFVKACCPDAASRIYTPAEIVAMESIACRRVIKLLFF
jgi:hypothetical protein